MYTASETQAICGGCLTALSLVCSCLFWSKVGWRPQLVIARLAKFLNEKTFATFAQIVWCLCFFAFAILPFILALGTAAVLWEEHPQLGGLWAAMIMSLIFFCAGLMRLQAECWHCATVPICSLLVAFASLIIFFLLAVFCTPWFVLWRASLVFLSFSAVPGILLVHYKASKSAEQPCSTVGLLDTLLDLPPSSSTEVLVSEGQKAFRTAEEVGRKNTCKVWPWLLIVLYLLNFISYVCVVCQCGDDSSCSSGLLVVAGVIAADLSLWACWSGGLRHPTVISLVLMMTRAAACVAGDQHWLLGHGCSVTIMVLLLAYQFGKVSWPRADHQYFAGALTSVLHQDIAESLHNSSEHLDAQSLCRQSLYHEVCRSQDGWIGSSVHPCALALFTITNVHTIELVVLGDGLSRIHLCSERCMEVSQVALCVCMLLLSYGLVLTIWVDRWIRSKEQASYLGSTSISKAKACFLLYVYWLTVGGIVKVIVNTWWGLVVTAYALPIIMLWCKAYDVWRRDDFSLLPWQSSALTAKDGVINEVARGSCTSCSVMRVPLVVWMWVCSGVLVLLFTTTLHATSGLPGGSWGPWTFGAMLLIAGATFISNRAWFNSFESRVLQWSIITFGVCTLLSWGFGVWYFYGAGHVDSFALGILVVILVCPGTYSFFFAVQITCDEGGDLSRNASARTFVKRSLIASGICFVCLFISLGWLGFFRPMAMGFCFMTATAVCMCTPSHHEKYIVSALRVQIRYAVIVASVLGFSITATWQWGTALAGISSVFLLSSYLALALAVLEAFRRRQFRVSRLRSFSDYCWPVFSCQAGRLVPDHRDIDLVFVCLISFGSWGVLLVLWMVEAEVNENQSSLLSTGCAVTLSCMLLALIFYGWCIHEGFLSRCAIWKARDNGFIFNDFLLSALKDASDQDNDAALPDHSGGQSGSEQSVGLASIHTEEKLSATLPGRSSACGSSISTACGSSVSLGFGSSFSVSSQTTLSSKVSSIIGQQEIQAVSMALVVAAGRLKTAKESVPICSRSWTWAECVELWSAWERWRHALTCHQRFCARLTLYFHRELQHNLAEKLRDLQAILKAQQSESGIETNNIRRSSTLSLTAKDIDLLPMPIQSACKEWQEAEEKHRIIEEQRRQEEEQARARRDSMIRKQKAEVWEELAQATSEKDIQRLKKNLRKAHEHGLSAATVVVSEAKVVLEELEAACIAVSSALAHKEVKPAVQLQILEQSIIQAQVAGLVSEEVSAACSLAVKIKSDLQQTNGQQEVERTICKKRSPDCQSESSHGHHESHQQEHKKQAKQKKTKRTKKAEKQHDLQQEPEELQERQKSPEKSRRRHRDQPKCLTQQEWQKPREEECEKPEEQKEVEKERDAKESQARLSEKGVDHTRNVSLEEQIEKDIQTQKESEEQEIQMQNQKQQEDHEKQVQQLQRQDQREEQEKQVQQQQKQDQQEQQEQRPRQNSCLVLPQLFGLLDEQIEQSIQTGKNAEELEEQAQSKQKRMQKRKQEREERQVQQQQQQLQDLQKQQEQQKQAELKKEEEQENQKQQEEQQDQESDQEEHKQREKYEKPIPEQNEQIPKQNEQREHHEQHDEHHTQKKQKEIQQLPCNKRWSEMDVRQQLSQCPCPGKKRNEKCEQNRRVTIGSKDEMQFRTQRDARETRTKRSQSQGQQLWAQEDAEQELERIRKELEAKSKQRRYEEEQQRRRRELDELERGAVFMADIQQLIQGVGPGGTFQDAVFPPSQMALGNRTEELLAEGYTWKRQSNVWPNMNLTAKGIFRPDDITQGLLGDCYFLSALACISQRPELMRSIFTHFDAQMGLYVLRFYKDMAWRDVIIDDFFPFRLGSPDRLAFSCALPKIRNASKKEFSVGEPLAWVQAVEKAYAKLHGSYDAIIGGHVGDALVELTGGIGEGFSLESGAGRRRVLDGSLWSSLLDLNLEGHLLACGSPTGSDAEVSLEGIVQGHAYSMLRVVEIDGHQLIQLRNPWGNTEWNGKWSDHDVRSWTARMRRKLSYEQQNKDDGIFWMCFDDWLAHFSEYYICKVFHPSDGWQNITRIGEWLGPTAGGCGNPPNEDGFLRNPFYHLRLRKPHILHMTLEQARSGSIEPEAENPFGIGFRIFRVNKHGCLSGRKIAGTETYKHAWRVCSECSNLQVDEKYVLVPATFEIGQESRFALRMFWRGAPEDVEFYRIASPALSGGPIGKE